jgi:hypothetical protein
MKNKTKSKSRSLVGVLITLVVGLISLVVGLILAVGLMILHQSARGKGNNGQKLKGQEKETGQRINANDPELENVLDQQAQLVKWQAWKIENDARVAAMKVIIPNFRA